MTYRSTTSQLCPLEQKRPQSMSMALSQLNFICGNLNLNFLSLYHVMKYIFLLTFFNPSNIFKKKKNLLVHHPYKNGWWSRSGLFFHFSVCLGELFCRCKEATSLGFEGV